MGHQPEKVPELVLKKNKEFSLMRGHPWVYRDALKGTIPDYSAGTEVKVLSHKGLLLGIGFIDPESPILVRMVAGFASQSLQERVASQLCRAIKLRLDYFHDGVTTAYRLCNGEGDGIPGLVIDRYADAVCVQLYTTGLERYLSLIVSIVREKIPKIRWILQQDRIRRTKAQVVGLLFGSKLPEHIQFLENGMTFRTDIVHGQKTGFFLDQRDNRQLIRNIAKGCSVANVCGYTGAFSVAAAAGGATSSVTIDIAAPALRDAQENLKLNGYSLEKHTVQTMDMYEFLQGSGQAFDLMIVDPPSMAKSRKEVRNALRAYYRLNKAAISRVRNGGVLFTASCSSQVSRDDFLDTIREAIWKSGKTGHILHESAHALDHPIAAAHIEGRYLKGFLLQLTS